MPGMAFRSDMEFISLTDWFLTFKGVPPYPSGESRLERLPTEILTQILVHLSPRRNDESPFLRDNLPAIPTAAPLPSFSPCLVTSKKLYLSSIPLLYSNVTFYTRDKAASLANSLERNRELGILVRSLDFQPLRGRTSIRDLRKCLSLTLNLKSLYLHLNDLCTDHLLRSVFFETPSLKTLEITRKASDSIDETAGSMMAVFFGKQDSKYVCNVTNLTFRVDVLASTFILWKLLPRCPMLRKLDIRHTPVDAEALESIPESVRLVHLDLSHCASLEESRLARFLTSHPAVKDSLISLHCEINDYGPAAELGEEAVQRILEELPMTVRSLHLGSFIMSKTHLPSLRKLCEQGRLEELGIGNGLTMRDIEAVVLGSPHEFNEVEEDEEFPLGPISDRSHEARVMLDPVRQAIAITKLRGQLDSISQCQKALMKKKSRLRYLDISRMKLEETWKISRSVLLGAESIPLGKIVIDDSAFQLTGFKELTKTCASVGWTVKGSGKSRWIERTEK